MKLMKFEFSDDNFYFDHKGMTPIEILGMLEWLKQHVIEETKADIFTEKKDGAARGHRDKA